MAAGGGEPDAWRRFCTRIPPQAGAEAGQVAWTIYGYESLWLPASLLHDNSGERPAIALFAGSCSNTIELHFNKELAGAPLKVIEAARNTAPNPAVRGAFALAIVANKEGGYPGVCGAGNRMSGQGKNPATRFIV